MTEATCIPIRHDVDIVTARREGRALATSLGFSGGDLTMIATAISEVARNILVYAGHGEVRVAIVARDGRRGIEVVAADEGPGIPDIQQAMQDGFSTSKSLGLGLPGVRRMMDELELASTVGRGTTVTMRKWARR